MKNTEKRIAWDTLDTLAKAYQKKGYKVISNPSENDLPAFLCPFHPNLVALSKDDKVVVEVKSRSRVTGSRKVIKLAELIESKPGWRYELIIDRPSSAERIKTIRSKPSLTKKEIAVRLSTSMQLLKDGLEDCALLLGWTAAEAVFRRLLYSRDIPLDNLNSSYLIKTLYSNGLIGWRKYEQVQKAFATRSQIAHGFVVKDLDKKAIERFLKLIGDLSSELETTSASSSDTANAGGASKKNYDASILRSIRAPRKVSRLKKSRGRK